MIQKACRDEAGEGACYAHFEPLITSVAKEYETAEGLPLSKALSFCWFYFPILLKKYVRENSITDFSSYYREYMHAVITEYIQTETESVLSNR